MALVKRNVASEQIGGEFLVCRREGALDASP